jgi:hypothetical protein
MPARCGSRPKKPEAPAKGSGATCQSAPDCLLEASLVDGFLTPSLARFEVALACFSRESAKANTSPKRQRGARSLDATIWNTFTCVPRWRFGLVWFSRNSATSKLALRVSLGGGHDGRPVADSAARFCPINFNSARCGAANFSMPSRINTSSSREKSTSLSISSKTADGGS